MTLKFFFQVVVSGSFQRAQQQSVREDFLRSLEHLRVYTSIIGALYPTPKGFEAPKLSARFSLYDPAGASKILQGVHQT